MVTEVVEAFKKEVSEQTLLSSYMVLLEDPEREVKLEALKGVSAFAVSMQAEAVAAIGNQLLPVLTPVANGADLEAKRALGTAISYFAVPVKGQSQDKPSALKLFFQLLKDPDSKTRLAVLESLDFLPDTLSIESLKPYLLEALEALASQEDWRVRLELPKHYLALCKKMNETFANDQRAKAVHVRLLRDSVFAVREESLNALKGMAVHLEKSWLDAHLLELLEPFLREPDFSLRMNYFLAMSTLAKNLSIELQKKVLARVKEAYDDPQANLRMVALSTLSALLAQMKEKKARDEVKAWAETKDDGRETDPDVKNSLLLLLEEARN